MTIEFGTILQEQATWTKKHLDNRRIKKAGLQEQNEIITGLGIFALHCAGAFNGNPDGPRVTPSGEPVTCSSTTPLTEKTAEYIATIQYVLDRYNELYEGKITVDNGYEEFKNTRNSLALWLGQELLDLT